MSQFTTDWNFQSVSPWLSLMDKYNNILSYENAKEVTAEEYSKNKLKNTIDNKWETTIYYNMEILTDEEVSEKKESYILSAQTIELLTVKTHEIL